MGVITVKSYRRRSVKGRTVLVKSSSRGSKSQISGQRTFPNGRTYTGAQSAKLANKAGALKRKLAAITGRGGFLSKPQRKAFFKASTIEAQHLTYGAITRGILRKR